MVRRIKAKLVPGLRDQGLPRNVYCFNVCWAKNLMSKNTEPFPSKSPHISSSNDHAVWFNPILCIVDE